MYMWQGLWKKRMPPPRSCPWLHSHCHLVPGLLGPVSHPQSCSCALDKRAGGRGWVTEQGRLAGALMASCWQALAPLFSSPWLFPTYWGAFPSHLLASWPFLLASSHNPKMSPSVLCLNVGTPPSPGYAGVPVWCLAGSLRLRWAPLHASALGDQGAGSVLEVQPGR